MSVLRLSSLLKATGVVFAALAAAAPTLHARQATTDLRILPLGDSITFGWWSSTLNGYRFNLQSLLQNASYELQYIGDLHAGNMSNNANEGLIGQTISQVQANGLGPINGSQPLPNLILLHIGTNDAANGVSSPAQMITDLYALMDAIYAAAPNVTVVLSEIIGNKNATTQATIDAYNAQIPSVVAAQRSAARPVVGVKQSDVDLNHGDGDTIFPDDPTHPGDPGFVKIARNFFGGIQAARNASFILPPVGTITPAPHGRRR